MLHDATSPGVLGIESSSPVMPKTRSLSVLPGTTRDPGRDFIGDERSPGFPCQAPCGWMQRLCSAQAS